jgi:hypothetical protein
VGAAIPAAPQSRQNKDGLAVLPATPNLIVVGLGGPPKPSSSLTWMVAADPGNVFSATDFLVRNTGGIARAGRDVRVGVERADAGAGAGLLTALSCEAGRGLRRRLLSDLQAVVAQGNARSREAAKQRCPRCVLDHFVSIVGIVVVRTDLHAIPTQLPESE